jgi:hypothetical protein
MWQTGRQKILDRTVAAIPQSALRFFEPVIVTYQCFFPPLSEICHNFKAFITYSYFVTFSAFCSQGHKIILSFSAIFF